MRRLFFISFLCKLLYNTELTEKVILKDQSGYIEFKEIVYLRSKYVTLEYFIPGSFC